MPSPRELFDDPDFMGLPDAEKIKVMSTLDPDFGALPPEEQTKVFGLYGGGGGSSLDQMLASPSGGPTVEDEKAATPSPLWSLLTPGMPPDLAAGYGRGMVKGLGQGVHNLGVAAQKAVGMSSPPEMPEFLRTGDGMEGFGAGVGRLAPAAAASFAAPGLGTAVGAGALGGAMESGEPEGAVLGGATGGGFHGVSKLGPLASEALSKLPPHLQAAAAKAPGVLAGAGIGTYLGEDWKGALAGALFGGTNRGSRIANSLLGTPNKRSATTALRAAAAEAKAAVAAEKAAALAARAEQKALLGARAGAEETAEGLGQGSFRASVDDEVEAALAQRFPPPPVGPDKLSSSTSTAVPTPRSSLGRTLKKAGADRTFRETSTAPTASAEIGEESLAAAKTKAEASTLEETSRKSQQARGEAQFREEKAHRDAIVEENRRAAREAADEDGPLTPMGPPPSGKPSSTSVPVPSTPPTTDAVSAARKKATTPQERGNMLRDLTGKGKSKAEKGAALSDETNPPLDPNPETAEDIGKAAKELLDGAGSLEEALRLIREDPTNSVQDVIRQTRAVREASRRAK